MFCFLPAQYLLDPAKGMTGAEVNQLHVHGGSALMEVGIVGCNGGPNQARLSIVAAAIAID